LPTLPDQYAQGPEALVVGLARTGDREAFAELVRRRQSWIRNLMRRCCGDESLADDLAQQVFLQAWRGISRLREPDRFGAWLKRLAINVWLQHARWHDVLDQTDDAAELAVPDPSPGADRAGTAADLDRALATLSSPVRLCIVLSYHEGMTHDEIAELTELPLGTVKSHIRRGTERLRRLLAAYRPEGED
jgi:RNA polymerase sigma-70 factor (ECF subfamily)